MKKNIIKLLIGLIVGILLIALWINVIDIDEMLTYMQKLKIQYVILSAFLYIAAYFVRALRWQIILSPIVQISAWKSFNYWMAGNFLNYIIPIRAGEFAKSYFLKKSNRLPISQTFPSVFIDKMFDSIAIFIVIILIPFLSVNISKPLLILIISLIIVVIIGIIILVLSATLTESITNLLQKMFFFIPEKYKKKFDEKIAIFVKGTGVFKHHMNLLPKVILLTILAVLIDSIYFFFIFKAFGQTVAFMMILFGYTLIYLSYIFPQPPAQIGSNELIMVIIFSIGLGLNKEMVSAVMAFAHVLTGLIITTIGGLTFSITGIKLFEFIKTNNGVQNE